MRAIACLLIAISIANAFHSPLLARSRFYFSTNRLSRSWSTRLRSTPDYLAEAIRRKSVEVEMLEKQYADPSCDVQMRMQFMAENRSSRIVQALRRDIGAADDEGHKTAVIIDLKRRSPTSHVRDVLPFTSAATMIKALSPCNVDAYFINTDEVHYGGSIDDLKNATRSPEGQAVPLIYKDFIIHPIQISVALEAGAAGVYLMANVLGSKLDEMLHMCTVMGTEAVVEVHTRKELELAIASVAPIIMVNNWDRINGVLHPEQALLLRDEIPPWVVTIAGGGVTTIDQALQLAAAGYDAVVIGRGLAGIADPKAFISTIRDKRFTPMAATEQLLRPS